jgi:hypothetical protein
MGLQPPLSASFIFSHALSSPSILPSQSHGSLARHYQMSWFRGVNSLAMPRMFGRPPRLRISCTIVVEFIEDELQAICNTVIPHISLELRSYPASRRSLAMSISPWWAARWSAVRWFRSLASTSTLYSSNVVTASILSFLTAQCNGIFPIPSSKLMDWGSSLMASSIVISFKRRMLSRMTVELR